MAASEAIQTISRLTPLADVLLMIDAEVKSGHAADDRCFRGGGTCARDRRHGAGAPGLLAGLAGRVGVELRRDTRRGRLRAGSARANAAACRSRPGDARGDRQHRADRRGESCRWRCRGADADQSRRGSPGGGWRQRSGNSAAARRRAIDCHGSCGVRGCRDRAADGARAALSRFAVARQRYHNRRGTIGLHGHRAARRRCAI